jgi:hypothetical protein
MRQEEWSGMRVKGAERKPKVSPTCSEFDALLCNEEQMSKRKIGRIRAFLLCLCVASAGLAVFTSYAQNSSGTFLVFGPMEYTRNSDQPIITTKQFTVAQPNAVYYLRIYNGGLNHQYSKEAMLTATAGKT